MASKKLTINIDIGTVIYTSITKSGDNYNSARLVAKIADKTYMNITVEWEGNDIPSFAMDLMGTLKANAMTAGKVVVGREEEYGEYLNTESSAKKQTCPDGHMWDSKMGKCVPE